MDDKDKFRKKFEEGRKRTKKIREEAKKNTGHLDQVPRTKSENSPNLINCAHCDKKDFSKRQHMSSLRNVSNEQWGTK